MTLFFSLLPLYLFGNLHCMGMCGPLVMMIGQHRYRFFYFFGRIASFSLAGLIAGEMGAVLHLVLKKYYFAEIISLLCGIAMIGWGLTKIIGFKNEGKMIKGKHQALNPLQRWVSTLLLKDTGWSAFLFGFFTVALPCGQTLVVFSACALAGNGWIGLANGFAFALLTTPSLVLAMHALHLFKRFKHFDQAILGGCSILVGAIACCRGLAEMGWISHWIVNPSVSTSYHLVIF